MLFSINQSALLSLGKDREKEKTNNRKIQDLNAKNIGISETQ